MMGAEGGLDTIETIAKNLHPLEVKVALGYTADDELTVERVERELGLKAGNGNQALSWLAAKELIAEKRREARVFYELTDLGRQWLEKGSPEERLLELARAAPALSLPEAAEKLHIAPKDAGAAFGNLSKRGALRLDEEKRLVFVDGASASASAGADYVAALRGLLEKGGRGTLDHAELSGEEARLIGTVAKKRGAADAAFRLVERETVVWAFTGAWGALTRALKEAGICGDEIGTLSAEMLERGSWKGKRFRPYDVRVPPARLDVGRTNAYMQFLERTKDKLVSLGFEEFDGPLVETEFWNCDALFMPQFHSARDIHDVYHIAEPAAAASIDEPWLSNVAAAHENGGATGSRGWNYAFDRSMTRRLILRSQGTAMSAKTLPRAKIPGKYFGMLRCFRYDKVDATHLSDFYQTEGIVLGEEVNLRTLLGMLEMFAVEVAGAKEVKYVPGYFPFTEPSIEVHIKHPDLGWFELGGSGIFRPEVTESLGVTVPVAAWGIGIDRMALMALGLRDLRDLFSYDIESVRTRRSV